ncbi:hypothetical protein [Orrella marina]|nr:hypothetical protein [Orrella marina]
MIQQTTPARTDVTEMADTAGKRDAGLAKLKRTAESLLFALFEHADMYYASDSVVRAWETMTLDAELMMDKDVFPEVETLFPHWFLHDWRPDEVRLLETGNAEPEQPVAEHYLQTRGRSVAALERRIIEAIDRSYFSYYRVLDYQTGHSVMFDDLMTGKQHVVHDLQYFVDLEPGMVFYMRLLTVDGNTIPYGLGPLIIRAHWLDDIQKLHIHLAMTHTGLSDSPDTLPLLDPEVLREEEPTLRKLYFSIRRKDDESYGRMWPSIYDEFKITQIIYSLNCQPYEALDALASLSGFDVSDLMEFDAVYDDDDNLVYVYIPWFDHEDPDNPSWDSDTLADIYIDQDGITVNMNSIEMLDEIETEITSLLGDLARLESSGEVVIPEIFDESDFLDDAYDPLIDSLPSLTRSLNNQTAFDRNAEDYWEKWMDDKLPELGGITPREASRTKEGCQALNVMLAEFEDLAKRHIWIRPVIEMLRRKLGLTD